MPRPAGFHPFLVLLATLAPPLLLLPAAASAQTAPGAEARAAIETALSTGYGGDCGDAPPGGEEREIDAWEVTYEVDWTEEPQSATLYRALCMRGAYNAVHAWFRDDGYGLAPVVFAAPNLAIRYRDEAQETLKSIAVDGWQGKALLVDAEFDPQDGSVTTYSAWRGLGDAYSSARYVLEEGAFVLVRFEVDPTYDGEQDATVVFERE
jgi:hypothetical protein